MLWKRPRECEGCGELREELRKATSRLEGLVLDWETLQDKVHRWMQRTSARVRSEEREQAAGAGSASPLPGIDPVSARILAERARRHAFVAARQPDGEDK